MRPRTQPTCPGFIADEPPVFHERRGRRSSFFHDARLAPGQRLLAAGALQQRDFGALVHLVEVFGIAPRFKMDVGLVVRNGGRLDGIIARLLRQFLEGVVGLLAHQVTLFQPSFDSGGGADPGKTAVASPVPAPPRRFLPCRLCCRPRPPGRAERPAERIRMPSLCCRFDRDCSRRGRAHPPAGGEKNSMRKMGGRISRQSNFHEARTSGLSIPDYA